MSRTAITRITTTGAVLFTLAFTTSAAAQVPIVYSRCPRTDENITIEGEVTVDGTSMSVSREMNGWDIYDRLPDVKFFHRSFVAPCDLMLLDADGVQSVLHDCSTISTESDACAAMDPVVSFDGKTIAYTVLRGALERERIGLDIRVLHPDAEAGDLPKVELPTPRLVAQEAQIHLVDVATGEITALPRVEGALDTGPTFLPNGRLMFTSTRDGNHSTIPFNQGTGKVGVRLYTMDPDGRNMDLAAPDSLGVEEHPIVLQDGRVAFSSWQVGMGLTFRGTALDNLFHIYTRNPDGSNLFALYGQHIKGTRNTVSNLDHKAAHFLTQTGDGRVWLVDYYRGNNNGMGAILGVMPEAEGFEGIGPPDTTRLGDLFVPRDLVNLFPWGGGSGDQMSAPMTLPTPPHPNYAGMRVFAGKFSHPTALPDGLAVVWGNGACSTVASDAVYEALGREAPPVTSGSGGGTAVNVIASLEMDTPGCDAGVYQVNRIPSEGPEDLALIVDDRAWHEIQPRAVVAYADIHGMDAPTPIARADQRTNSGNLPIGTPFGLLGAASMVDRETHPTGGLQFEGNNQFFLQGTDTVLYDDADICGLRILGVIPNRGEAAGQGIANVAGERIAILGEVPVRNRAADGSPILGPGGAADTSFLVRFPADVPYFMQSVDCDGRTLNTDQTWQSLRPGEEKTCGGCHVHSREPLNTFEEMFAATSDYQVPHLGEGIVPLLAGNEGGEVAQREVAGYGLQVVLDRDVMPIFEQRCVGCHGGADPDAGLALDRPGTDPGSTWHCLVNDDGQSCVPSDRQWRNAKGRTALEFPQLTKYARAFNSRGSLLYWKAANERTDGRTDADTTPGWEEDIDFGNAHPTEITNEELGVLSRWIDLGMPGGEGELIDYQRPTLTLAAIVQDDVIVELRVGSVDLGSGIDESSLEVCVLEGAECGNLLAERAEPHGIVEVALGEPLSDPEVEVRARVLDKAGNETIVVRTVRYLLNALPPDGGTDGGGDGGTADGGATDGGMADGGTGDGGMADDETGDGGATPGEPRGCGCRGTGGTPNPGWLVLLFFLVGTRRLREAQ